MCFLSTLYCYLDSMSKDSHHWQILHKPTTSSLQFFLGMGEIFQDLSSQVPNNMHSEITVNTAHYKFNFSKTQTTLDTLKHG